jgi:broad specificity phosphatase PhoE
MQIGSSNLELWLIRHGETEWSASGAHTSRTDIPLTEHGRQSAGAIRHWLAGREFSLILTSSRIRAQETCRIAGYAAVAQVDDNLTEWDYGEYEGRTTADIRKDKPEWSIWTTTVHGGETVHQVAGRAHMVIDRAVADRWASCVVFPRAFASDTCRPIRPI